MSSDRTLQLYVPVWDAHTFAAAADTLSEAGFVPEVVWEATVREAHRLLSAGEHERVMKMWNDGKQVWLTLEPHGAAWIVQVSLPDSWFEQHHDDWRLRLVAFAAAFHATEVVVHEGEAGEDPIEIADDGDLAELLAKDSIAEVWLASGQFTTAPFQSLAGYRLFRSER